MVSRSTPKASNAAIAAVVGGATSEVAGGSFEEGALTAAMGRMFNDFGIHIRSQERQQLARVGIDQREVDAKAFEVVQMGLDVVGTAPGPLGCAADLTNAGLSAITGDLEGAAGVVQAAFGSDSAKFAKYMTKIRNEAPR
jgi:hypothetical protein